MKRKKSFALETESRKGKKGGGKGKGNKENVKRQEGARKGEGREDGGEGGCISCETRGSITIVMATIASKLVLTPPTSSLSCSLLV